ncbi:MAG: GNAT family N-acetyltransferase [Anaerolineales bacterium]|nr:GNAT family N-acetyltransferase [Anaerolineales bacterium]
MTAISKPHPIIQSALPPQIRPLKLPGDLRAVADLVELCFEASLDADGHRLIRQMRQAASRRGGYPGGSGMVLKVKGFVWVEDGKIVGNISIIPVVVRHRRASLIANVAVHPDHRQKGIARALTEVALARIKTSDGNSAVLQVDYHNHHAQQLYRSYGFIEKATRTTWHGDGSTQINLPPSVKVRKPIRADWPYQLKWLDQLYNQEVRWNLPFYRNLYSPGFFGIIGRAFHQHQIRQWTSTHHGSWIGSLTWQSSYNQADWLWLAAAPDKLELATCTLIPTARQELLNANLIKPGRILAINYPAGENLSAFEAIGFRQHNTLIWMQKDFK